MGDVGGRPARQKRLELGEQAQGPDRRPDLERGGVRLLQRQGALADELVRMVELRRQRGEVPSDALVRGADRVREAAHQHDAGPRLEAGRRHAVDARRPFAERALTRQRPAEHAPREWLQFRLSPALGRLDAGAR